MPSMPLSALPGQSGSAAGEVVLGVDTHKGVHAEAVLTALGALLAARTFPATAAGYRDLVSWARSSARCSALAWSAPGRTGPRWPGTCAARASR